jgi:serine/threonine-protein kinase
MTLPQIPYYEVVSELGAGGTGTVYCGRSLLTHYGVAIKILHPSRAKDDYVVSKFKEEANRYLYLVHPNIPRLVDYIEHLHCLIMEYVEGSPLNEYISRVTGPMPDEILIPMFLEILDTIAYLHQNRTLHLDIKPGNVMVLKDRKIKILDMGISADVNETHIKRCGSPAFMSPEQIKGEQLGFYTDIFALGVTLFNMATFHLPFSGANHTEIFQKTCNEPTPLAMEFYPGINPRLQRVIERAMRKNSTERYQTCEEFAMDLLELQ